MLSPVDAPHAHEDQPAHQRRRCDRPSVVAHVDHGQQPASQLGQLIRDDRCIVLSLASTRYAASRCGGWRRRSRGGHRARPGPGRRGRGTDRAWPSPPTDQQHVGRRHRTGPACSGSGGTTRPATPRPARPRPPSTPGRSWRRRTGAPRPRSAAGREEVGGGQVAQLARGNGDRHPDGGARTDATDALTRRRASLGPCSTSAVASLRRGVTAPWRHRAVASPSSNSERTVPSVAEPIASATSASVAPEASAASTASCRAAGSFQPAAHATLGSGSAGGDSDTPSSRFLRPSSRNIT